MSRPYMSKNRLVVDKAKQKLREIWSLDGMTGRKALKIMRDCRFTLQEIRQATREILDED